MVLTRRAILTGLFVRDTQFDQLAILTGEAYLKSLRGKFAVAFRLFDGPRHNLCLKIMPLFQENR